jgi:hypothetical protein
MSARASAIFSALAVASSVAAAASCSLLVDTHGLTGGSAVDGGTDSNAAEQRPDASPGGDAAPAGSSPSPDSGLPLPTAIAFVQARESDTGSGTSLSIAFGSNVTSHDAVIVCVSIYTLAVTMTGMRDTQGNTYTTVVGPFDGNGTRHYIAVALDVAGGPDTVTVTVSGNPAPYLGMHIHEYSGVARTAAFDMSSAAAGTSSAVDGMASGAKPTTADQELIFGYGVSSDTAYPGTGFTARSGFSTGDVTEDKVVSVRGAYQATATMVSGSNWEMLMATFRAN